MTDWWPAPTDEDLLIEIRARCPEAETAIVAFWGLLGPSAGRPRPGSAIAWIVSSTAGLLGVIITDAIASRLRQASDHVEPVMQWLLGVMALLPAWLVALIGLAWARQRLVGARSPTHRACFTTMGRG